MTETDRELGKRWFEEVWNQGRREAIVELMAPDGVVHDGGTDSVGPEGFYPFFDRLNATFSEIHITVHDTVAEQDRICLRWSCRGKHTGDGLGIPPTGNIIEVTGLSLMRIANGHLAEAWQNWDMLGMMEQITERSKSPTYIGS